eukprot:3205677-Amphidinium_carterae.1
MSWSLLGKRHGVVDANGGEKCALLVHYEQLKVFIAVGWANKCLQQVESNHKSKWQQTYAPRLDSKL